MNILICPDKFKDCLSAPDAGRCIARGISRAPGSHVVQVIPMADGGEGTLDALLGSLGGELVEVVVHDPLMRKVRAVYGMLDDSATAVIEMAAASGLSLLGSGERDPLQTTTYGTGELIADALGRGCERIILGVGGSATVDGGCGMASALGVRFLDSHGQVLPPGGGALLELAEIDLSGLHGGLAGCTVEAACDVTNPLTGTNGSALVYGPQKGATEAEAGLLDKCLAHLAKQIEQWLHKRVESLPGAGAAGGLGAGIAAFLGGSLRPGVDLISGVVNLAGWINWADLVITGEGRMDRQTSFGKTPAGVARLCLAAGKPVVALTGAVHESEVLYELGFRAVMPIADRPMSLEDSLARAGQLLEQAAERLMRLQGLFG